MARFATPNVARVAGTDSGARQRLLDAIAEAVDADRLEEQLFGPVQSAYARVQRTHTEFAGRHGLPAVRFAPHAAAVASRGARGPIDDAVEAVRSADHRLSELQDSFLPIEYGDPELRSGLSDVRMLLGSVAGRARELVRVLGR
jgi:hypothetical protein